MDFSTFLNNYEIFLFSLAVILLSVVWRHKSTKNAALPTDWPVVGMLPAILQNRSRIHDYATELLAESGGTFDFKGPRWFCSMDMLITSEPADIHQIFSRNFSNYPKGPEFRKIFEILGDGIFNVDFELWELHRRTTLAFLTNVEFYGLLERSVWNKVETGLLPVLDHFCEKGSDLDLQDIFQRLTFDSICKIVLDFDPCSLSLDLPYVPCEKAFNDAIDALLHRYILPEKVWKLQRWLKIGKERKLIQAWKTFDEFLYPIIVAKEEDNRPGDDLNLLTAFKVAYEEQGNSFKDSTREFLRDTALSLMLAGRDTTSTCLTWLFWLIATNPSVENKIREEFENELQLKQGKTWRRFGMEESRKLVYLHGALCESLRLFPPVALEQKAPVRPDMLPSGNHLEENKRVIISFYSTGRMETVWGKDCLEFKPERWISARGGIKHEPSYKFPAFNAGPRTCLGKEMAFVQMKMVAAAIMHHYDFKVVEGHPVSPRDSIILQTKHGLKVRLKKRNV